MKHRLFLIGTACAVSMLIAACGTVAPSVFSITSVPDVVESGNTIAQIATSTPLPTATAVATRTPEPTIVPTLEPTLEATEAVVEAAAAVVIGDAAYGATDPQKFAVDNFGDATRGETLFNQTFVVNEAEWACSTCHNVVGEEVKIGPSQWNIGLRAPERVPGEGPYTYLYNAIHNSQLYIVPTYEDKTHMPIYEDVLTDSQIYDLVKYLLILHD